MEKAAHPPEQTRQRATEWYHFTRALLLPSACGLGPSYGRRPKRRFELVQGQIFGGVSAVCHDPGLGHSCGCSGSGVFTRASGDCSLGVPQILQFPSSQIPKVGAWPSLGSPVDWLSVNVKSREELISKAQDARKNGSDSPQGLQLARLGVSGRRILRSARPTQLVLVPMLGTEASRLVAQERSRSRRHQRRSSSERNQRYERDSGVTSSVAAGMQWPWQPCGAVRGGAAWLGGEIGTS